ncbi:MAG TPA: hypothetical protein VEX68_23940 [Bryobacteraceae bacterium]|nr:hypothetical protein [Bryobacteraceae bacterium]
MLWPGGKKFAFTIFDDTDWATIERVKPVYDVLRDLDFRTTKSVWMLNGSGQHTKNGGSSCEDPAYLKWVRDIQSAGFEIALHNAAPVTSERRIVERALEEFKREFGAPPSIHCNHTGCLENLYWGDTRLSGWRRSIYQRATSQTRNEISYGHVEGHRLFWGDLCQRDVTYVRNFVYNDLNTLASCPEMPYHDANKPYVNFWFASAEGGNLRRFLANFTCSAIDRLERQSGLCIAYVHFGGGFADRGQVKPEFRRILEYVAKKDPWLPTVTEALEYLRHGADRKSRTISVEALRRLEILWLLDKGAVKVKDVFSRSLKTVRSV